MLAGFGFLYSLVGVGLGQALAAAEAGETVTLGHPLGPLTFRLSAREALSLGGTLRLGLDLEQVRQVPDDREP